MQSYVLEALAVQLELHIEILCWPLHPAYFKSFGAPYILKALALQLELRIELLCWFLHLEVQSPSPLTSRRSIRKLQKSLSSVLGEPAQVAFLREIGLAGG